MEIRTHPALRRRRLLFADFVTTHVGEERLPKRVMFGERWSEVRATAEDRSGTG